MPIYMAYKVPDEPPEELWLIINLETICFKTKQDIEYVEQVIIKYNPELFTTINTMYKVYRKNLESCLKIEKRIDGPPPKIMKKVKKNKI